MLTIPSADFKPGLPDGVQYIKGQLETGDSGYEHWQLIVAMPKNCRLSAIKNIFGQTCHAELTRSAAAEEYVWKDATHVPGKDRFFGQDMVWSGVIDLTQ